MSENCENCRWAEPASDDQIRGTIELFESLAAESTAKAEERQYSDEELAAAGALLAGIIVCTHPERTSPYNTKPGSSPCDVIIRGGFLGLGSRKGFEPK